MIKGSIEEEDITVVNIRAPSIGSPQYIEQLLTALKGKINNNTIIVGDFNTLLRAIHKSYRQKNQQGNMGLKWCIRPDELIDNYGIFQTKATDYTFFSSAYRTFSRTDHILGHKSSLGKFKKIETVSSIFSDHNSIWLEINHKEITAKKKTQTHAD